MLIIEVFLKDLPEPERLLLYPLVGAADLLPHLQLAQAYGSRSPEIDQVFHSEEVQQGHDPEAASKIDQVSMISLTHGSCFKYLKE